MNEILKQKTIIKTEVYFKRIIFKRKIKIPDSQIIKCQQIFFVEV